MPNDRKQNPQAIQHKTIAYEIKSINDETGEIEGYGNVKNVLDHYDDEVIDGAYVELDSTVKDGFVAIGHDWYSLPVATIEEAREDAKGLYVRLLPHSTEEAQKMRTVVKERKERGKSIGLSIGYFAIEWEWQDRDGVEVRVLKKIKVVEVSIVTVPANAQSQVTAVKHGSGATFEQKVEGALAAFDDLASRFDWFAKNRKKGLSEKHVSQIEEMKARLDALLATKTDDDTEGSKTLDPEQARLIEAKALEQRLRLAGLVA